MTEERTEPVEVVLPAWGVRALESHHAPSFRMTPSRHDFMELFLVFSGTGVFLLDHDRYPVAAHDVVVVPPGVEHAIHDQPADPLWLFGLCIDPVHWKDEPGVRERLDRRKPGVTAGTVSPAEIGTAPDSL